jgi:hypothetical protein
MTEAKANRGYANEQLSEIARGCTEDASHLSAGLILGHRQDLGQGFLVGICEPDRAAVSEDREEEGVK